MMRVCPLSSAVVVADYYLLRNDHQTHCCSKRNESFKATTFSSFLSSSSQWFMPPSSLFHLLWKKTVWFVYFSSSNPEKVILAVGSVKTKDQVYAVTRGLVLTFILLTYQKHFKLLITLQSMTNTKHIDIFKKSQYI